MILQLLWDAEIPGIRDNYRAYGGKETHRHWLYRVYTCADRLLYVGCAVDVVSRMQVHASSWGNPVSAALNFYGDRLVVSEPIIGQSAARAAEKAAIQAEAPLLNTHHNKGRSVLRSPEAWTEAEDVLRADRAAITTERAA